MSSSDSRGSSNRALPRLAVLISGSGRSLENLQEQIVRGRLDAQIVLVVSSRADAYGLVRAERLEIPSTCLPRSMYEDSSSYSDAVFGEIRAAGAELVCLMGFLSLLRIPPDFEGRVLNIHPALLPSFGGKGMYGRHVHEAVLAAGETESGCTVHYCNNEYDSGEILLQRRCKVLKDDDPERLAARVFEEEKLAYPEALRQVIARIASR